MSALWNLPIIDGPLPWVVYTLGLAVAIALLVRRTTVGWVITALLGIVGGVAVALVVFFMSNTTNAFGDRLPLQVLGWSAAAFAGIGLCVVSFVRTRVWRKIVAAVGILIFALVGSVGVNAYYGLNPTLGSLFGVSGTPAINLPTGTPTSTDAAGLDLYKKWTPPAGMPTKGTQGTQVIPATVSGFQARPAGLYLPPAALVPNAPALPLVIMMMGYPGNPDPSYIGSVLDDYAAANNGLAPIVIVADQIGTGGDPACADSTTYGKAKTYIKTDVVAWAKANLHISNDPKQWVIAGYSNGGGCAITYGAEEPATFKNILDISGEEYPGSEDVSGVVSQIYNGDQSAFEASKPVNILAAHDGDYADVTAVVTVGGNDPTFIPAAQTVSAAAKKAGMAVTYFVVPGAGHVVDGLDGGLTEGFKVLYPVLGLSAPN